MTIKRDEKGRIVKGSSALNPSKERQKSVKKRAKEAMEKYNIHPLDFLASVIANSKETTKNRITSAKELMDRAYGKSPVYVESDVRLNDADNKISIEIIDPTDPKDPKDRSYQPDKTDKDNK